MTDYSELVNDLREYLTTRQISDLLEAQAKRIATLEELRNEYRRAITQLKDESRTRIAELEKENERLRDLAYIAYQNGYKDAPPYSKYERSLDEIELMWKRSFAYAALKGEAK